MVYRGGVGFGTGLSAAEGLDKDRVTCRVEDVKISGYLGEKLDACIANNIKTRDGSYLAGIFQKHEGTSDWRTEFWGKMTCRRGIRP